MFIPVPALPFVHLQTNISYNGPREAREELTKIFKEIGTGISIGLPAKGQLGLFTSAMSYYKVYLYNIDDSRVLVFSNKPEQNELKRAIEEYFPSR